MARRATFIDSLRSENPNTLVVDAGNWGDLNGSYGKMKSDFIFKCMQKFNTDAVCLGDREFFWGARDFEREDGPPILIANVTDAEGMPIGQPSMIKDMGGIKVGVFGIVHDNVLARAGDKATDWTASDVFATTTDMVKQLEDDGAQVIVMLTQVELSIADSLLRVNPEIDVAVLGHRPGLRKTHGTIGETIVMRTGTRGQNVGLLNLTVDKSGEVLEYGGSSLELVDPIKKDPEVLMMVAETMAETKRLQGREREDRQKQYKQQFDEAKKDGTDAASEAKEIAKSPE